MDVHEGLVENVRLIAAGRIAPYLAVWGQILREGTEQPLDFSAQNSAGRLTVTAAGATAGTVRNLSQQVASALHRVTAPGGGEYVHSDPHVPIQYDTSVTPPRFYQPLSFTFAQP
ncbi:hypothetical protein AE0388_1530 [Brevibacterium linens]|uniref:Uncharacterized protein n=1 Tax=Brevibacterium linens TaxID=1703 RepID=A0A0B9AP01_BRELN|nr:hypothetical protein AE0388_1530 [Brevibacterium linens]